MLAALGARASGRPVKYIEDRIDNITASDNHGSDRTYDVELALDAIQSDDGAALPGSGRLRRLFSVRSRHPRQRFFANRRAVQHPRGRCGNLRRVHQQMPAGRLPRFRLGSHQFHDRTHCRCGGRRTQPRSDRFPARQFHPAGRISVPDPDRQSLRQRQLSRRARHGAANARLSTVGATSSQLPAPKDDMSALESRAARKRACSARPNSGCSTAVPDLR